jgi:DNA-binding response OmpR family regulator
MSLRVLVVDDNRALADNLAEILADEGCAPTTAYSAEQALQIAQQTHFDIVLTDIRMPGMSGVELIERLSARESRTTFLLMTAYTSDQMLSAAAHLGVVRAVLAKPLAIEKLLELLPRRAGAGRILVVETDGALAANLRARGYEVHHADSLARAHAIIDTVIPDIAVIDVGLPHNDGVILARELCVRSTSGPPGPVSRIPIIVLTALGHETDEAELRRIAPQAVQFITKPFATESLLAALEHIKQGEAK